MNFKIIISKLDSTPKVIGLLLFIITALLPIQNILVVFAVNVLNLPNWLALWKEVLVVILILFMKIDLWKNVGWKNLRFKWFFGSFGLLNLLVIISSFVINKVPIHQFILGYRFELLWLWLWVIGFIWVKNLDLKNLIHLQTYKNQLIKGIFLGFGLCLIFTLGQLTVGKDFVQFFGYTDSNLQLPIGKINSPICHTIDFGIDSCRLTAPFSSPNHLAGYLLFILGFSLLYAVKRGELTSIQKNISNFKISKINFAAIIHLIISGLTNYSFVPVGIIISILIFLTYSRFALFALILYWVFVAIFIFKQKVSKFLTVLILITTLIFTILITSIDPTWASKVLPNFLAKPSSSIEHYRLTAVSIDILKFEPKILLTGLGQGSSGSSTSYFRSDQNVIYNKFKDLSYKWFIKPERISVPENWYLELILNGGLLYAILYMFILIFPILNALYFSKISTNVVESKDQYFKNLFMFLAFFGILLGNVFLHLWENQTIAIYWCLMYIWWTLESSEIYTKKTI